MSRLAAVLILAALLPAAAADARRRVPPPKLLELRCVPVKTPRCANGPAVPRGLQVILRGAHLYSGMRVTFRWRTGAIATTLRRTRIGWVARVPASTRVGRVWVYVRDRRFRRSKAKRLRVLAARTTPPQPVPPPSGDVPAPFLGHGLWIWELSRTEGGNLAAIAERAKAAGVSTVFVKSADGTTPWSQFSSAMVSTLHAQGLKVCGWQYMYGASPVAEARAAAVAVRNGADCFVMDPESEFQGRYGAAQRYLDELRALVGESYPIGLTSFPYVDYHPSLPYSVFLAPGAAQVNVPQVYWKDIGGSVDEVSAHTLIHNRIYQRPIAPLGQAYDSPRASDIARFRQLWAAWGAQGISWWSWQSASSSTWTALGGPLPGEAVADPGWPVLARKAKGDQVIWLQQHLASADATVDVDGVFGDGTDAALRSFQTSRGLPATGTTDAATWAAILTLPVRAVDWKFRDPASARSAARSAPPSELPPSGRGGQPSSTSRTP